MSHDYYILNLWDHGTPAFVSCDKMYIGTEAEIRTAIEAMKKSDKGNRDVFTRNLHRRLRCPIAHIL